MANIPTNCGVLTPQTFELITFGGNADVQSGHIPYFHQKICEWAYTIAQPFSFVIFIHAQDKQNIINKIKSDFPTLEPTGWDVSQVVDDAWADDVTEVIGCIFAEGVRFPGETINVERVGITEGSRRGFINAPIITGRSDFEPLEIGFMETNQSFVDGVLRPWSILAAHYGLLARSDSIKADIIVYQLARAINETQNIVRKNVIRKQWTFKDCVPIYVSPEDVTYDATSSYPKKQVQFVYNSYQIEGKASITD
jgi:hypothetical protein